MLNEKTGVNPNEGSMDESNNFRICDITEQVTALSIKFPPTGENDTEEVIGGKEFLAGRYMYSIFVNDGTALNVITSNKLPEGKPLEHTIGRLSPRLGVYLDTETNIFVFGGGHRSAYDGVILTRALKSSVNNTAELDTAPNELKDKNIRSYDIVRDPSKGKYINTTSKNLTPEQQGVLRKLGIMTLDQYITEFWSAELDADFIESVSNKLEVIPTFGEISICLKNIFKNSFVYSTLRTDASTVVVTPGVLSGNQDYEEGYLSLRGMYDSTTDIDTLNTYTELLLTGNTIRVSIYACDTGSRIVLVCGWNHTDAIRFFEAAKGMDNLVTQNGAFLGEFTAQLSIDKDSLLHDRIKGLVLRLRLVGQNDDTILDPPAVRLTPQELVAKYMGSAAKIEGYNERRSPYPPNSISVSA